MGNILEIADLHAPELDVYARLTEAQLRSKKAPEQGLFIAESLVVIEYALAAGLEPVSFLMERRQITGQGAELLSRWPEVPVYTADREVLAQLTGYALTRGVLCALRRPPLPQVQTVCREARRIAVLENIVDPTNVGAIFRSAAALGMDGVLVTPSCCDPLSRRSVRVSMGGVFQLPWTRIGTNASDWPVQGMATLRSLGFQTAAMALRDNTWKVDDPRLSGADRLAVILGTEGSGLRSDTIDLCDCTVCIPMAHGMESLNVAAASAVAFWQLGRR